MKHNLFARPFMIAPMIIPVIAFGLSLTSCHPRMLQNSGLKIIGGQDAGQDILPWAVRMSIGGGGLCTGSFVSPNTMITASHCVRSNSKVSVARYEAKSIKIIEHPKSTDEVEPLDLAIVMFPANTATKWTRLTNRQPAAGDQVEMIGYGSCTRWDGPDTGTRRCRGTNKISGFDDRMIETARSNGVALSPGDSGGPLFYADESIVGIASGGDLGQGSMHVNLLLPENQDFLKDAVAKHQAVICGLDGVSDPVCGSNPNGNLPDRGGNSSPGDDEPVRIPDPVSDF
jgi:S1-C subfamily serine protease